MAIYFEQVDMIAVRELMNLIGAQKRSGFVATLLTLTAFGHAKARRDG
jgi:hypothetical protein